MVGRCSFQGVPSHFETRKRSEGKREVFGAVCIHHSPLSIHEGRRESQASSAGVGASALALASPLTTYSEQTLEGELVE